jgi:hypothetical protein
MISSAAAHDWYDGWCCHNKDCAPAGRVEYQNDGSLVIWNHGQPIAVPKDFPFRPSRDQNWHICVMNGRIRCIYMPAGV